MHPTPRPSRSPAFAILLVGALVGALALALAGPRPTPLGAPSGDPTLVVDARAALAPGTDLGVVSVVRIQDDVASWAGFGEVTRQSRFEIGSVTKTFTGLLLADAAERGEVTLDDRLEEHLPELAGTPAGSVTLVELGTHHSGLPAMAPHDGLLILAEDLAGAPYTAYSVTTDELIAAARGVPVATRGGYAYSNLGMSLLGHALARAAGVADYPTLIQDRLFTPLGMADAHIAPHGEPHPDTLQPHQSGGKPTAVSTSSGYAPAGIGVTLTASDLTAYARALLEGTAPGMDALAARADGPVGQRLGLTWGVSGEPGYEIVWHNGRTAGSTAMFALDRNAGTAAVIVTNRWAELTGAGLALLGLGDVMPAIPVVDPDTVAWVVVALVLVPVFALGAVLGRSRTRIGGQGLAAVGALVLWVLAAPWSWMPGWVFGALTGLTAAGLAVVALRWRALPWLPEKRAWLAVIAGALGLAWFAAMLALTGWVATLR